MSSLEETKVDQDATTKGQEYWNNLADFYEKAADNFTVQGLVTCASMVEITSAKKTLEVACGTGAHSVMLASTFIPDGGVLVSCDFSKAMIAKAKKNFSKSDYAKINGNKVLIDDEVNMNEKCNLQEII